MSKSFVLEELSDIGNVNDSILISNLTLLAK